MKKHNFPSDFLWGTSTAAHQVEGNNINSDWWHWEQEKKDRSKSGTACNHYSLFKEDFLLAKKLGHNAHRLSIEWARIEPRKGKYDQKEIDHYKKVFTELRRHKIKSFVTLWHFTLPKWFADKGGFEKKKNLKFFYRYIKKCAKEFNGLVDYWVTINEPTTYILKSYVIGIWPPQSTNIIKALTVYKNVCESHNEAYKIIKKNDRRNLVGAAHQLVSYYSEGGIVNDLITRLSNYLVNDFFYNNTHDNHDFMGLNYYFKNPVSLKYYFKKVNKDDYEKIIRDESHHLGWNMDPNGLSDCIDYLDKRFSKPIYILEHGISDPKDNKRQEYIRKALQVIGYKIQNGADVRGYLHWSLIDNFEWNLGFQSKFGLIAFDPKTFKRVPKKSAYMFKKIIENNKI